MTGRPMLALPEGEADAWRRSRDRCEVTGPWPEVERNLAAALLRDLAEPDRAHIVDIAGKRWAFGGPSAGGELLYGCPLQTLNGPRDPSWALVRVRVSVEVLDGIP